jgi:glutamate racemase
MTTMLNSYFSSSVNRHAPIGIFDSGVGGLTVVRAMEKILPDEDIVYFGDTARFPYGSRSPGIVTEFTLESAKLLFKLGIKLLIIACNTASSSALPELSKNIPVPMTGVINPGAHSAVLATKNNRIGIIGTEGTVSSRSYEKAILSIKADISVFSVACPLFVSLAQEGMTEGVAVDYIAKSYIDGFIGTGIDTLIMGCTHYPLLESAIKTAAGHSVRLIDSAFSTASLVKTFLMDYNLSKPQKGSEQRFFVSDAPEKFRSIGSRFLNHELSEVIHIRP